MRNKDRKKKLSKEERVLLMDLSNAVVRSMESQGAILEDVAKRGNVARSTVREIINANANAGVVTLRRIGAALGYNLVVRFEKREVT